MDESTSLLTRQSVTIREFESFTLRKIGTACKRVRKAESVGLTSWYKKNYPPQGGIGEARLTIHDPS